MPVKVRLASAVEKTTYEAATYDAEFYGDAKMVKLSDLIDRPAESGLTSSG